MSFTFAFDVLGCCEAQVSSPCVPKFEAASPNQDVEILKSSMWAALSHQNYPSQIAYAIIPCGIIYLQKWQLSRTGDPKLQYRTMDNILFFDAPKMTFHEVWSVWSIITLCLKMGYTHNKASWKEEYAFPHHRMRARRTPRSGLEINPHHISIICHYDHILHYCPMIYIYSIYYHNLSYTINHGIPFFVSSHGIPILIPALHSSHQNVAWHEGLRGLRGLAAPAQRRPGVQRCVPGDGRDVRHLEGMGWLWSVLHGFYMLSLGFYMVIISYH